ncbi:MAG: hypothetical protein LEGION0403_FIIPPAGN_02511 [Legionella sp.]|uniref:hypothetical protein n=1 Tax=Legionella sp. TaxID=459 RepID=UPI003D0D1625
MEDKNEHFKQDELVDSDNESPSLSEKYKELQRQRVMPQLDSFEEFKKRYKQNLNHPLEPNVPSIGNTLYIAIVDDDSFALMTGQMYVQRAQKTLTNYVLVAQPYQFPNDIKRFATDLERGYINGVLTDHDMPKMTGSALIKYVRNVEDDEVCKIPILLNSADTNPDDTMSKMLKDNQVPFVKKPLDFESFKKQLIDQVVSYDQNLKAQKEQNFKI